MLAENFFQARMRGMDKTLTKRERIRTVIDALSSRAIANRMGVTRRAVNTRARLGAFPASWAIALRDMAGPDLDIPDDLFGWKGLK